MKPLLTLDSFAKNSIARLGLYILAAGTLILGTLVLSVAFIFAIIMNDPQWASPY